MASACFALRRAIIFFCWQSVGRQGACLGAQKYVRTIIKYSRRLVVILGKRRDCCNSPLNVINLLRPLSAAPFYRSYCSLLASRKLWLYGSVGRTNARTHKPSDCCRLIAIGTTTEAISATPAASELKTLVTVRPPFSRATTATSRLPFWFSANRRSQRNAAPGRRVAPGGRSQENPRSIFDHR
jgi:hypothetical protein